MNSPAGQRFTSWWQNYEKNYRDGEQLRVVPTRLNHDRDTAKTGVAIFIGTKVTLVLTEDHAYKLANGIADALDGAEAA